MIIRGSSTSISSQPSKPQRAGWLLYTYNRIYCKSYNNGIDNNDNDNDNDKMYCSYSNICQWVKSSKNTLRPSHFSQYQTNGCKFPCSQAILLSCPDYCLPLYASPAISNATIPAYIAWWFPGIVLLYYVKVVVTCFTFHSNYTTNSENHLDADTT